MQSTLTSALRYIAYRYSLQLSGSSVFSGQTDGTNTSRNTCDALAQPRGCRRSELFECSGSRRPKSTRTSPTAGRVRLSAKPNLQLEVVRNLYWSFYLYENYD
jgi:hypothetical protein